MTVSSFAELGRYLRADTTSRCIKSCSGAFVLDPIYRFTVYLRLNEYLVNVGAPLVVRVLLYIFYRRLSVRLGFSVPLNVFGPGLNIVHYGLLVVNPNARVGANCRVHSGVNIGGSAGFYSLDEAAKLSPIIGDNCYIGPGAKIFGPVLIGNDCAIGANAVVNRSFPENRLTLVGIPAKAYPRKVSIDFLARPDS